jgi:hypothetical protein
MLSSLQLARLVQMYLAEPGVSIEQKAAAIGVRRNELLRAARGTISRTVRLRLLAYLKTAPAPRTPRRGTGVTEPIGSGNTGLHEPRSPPGGARHRTSTRGPRRRALPRPRVAVVP